MKKIVLFVEGEGEADAAPLLVKKILAGDPTVWQSVILDPDPFRVGEVNKLYAKDMWKKKLQAALKRRDVGGILLLLDGDIKKVQGKDFCAVSVAQNLANASKEVGGGTTFSVAVTFAIKEFESWLIASFDSLAGMEFGNGRRIPATADVPEDVEMSPRDAKGWFKDLIPGGYKAPRDQADLTKLLDPNIVRQRVRSFRRLDASVLALVSGIKTGKHTVSPDLPK